MNFCIQIEYGYNLTMEQKLQYPHNVLSKDALLFYLDSLQPYTTTFQQAVEMINRDYRSPVFQNRFKNYLTSLRVRDFEENGMVISLGLSKAYKLISKLSRQVSPSALLVEMAIVLSFYGKLFCHISGLMSLYRE